MSGDRVGVGVLVYLLLVCLSSVVTCVYLLWQGLLLPGSRGRHGCVRAGRGFGTSSCRSAS